jgi:hypothetical protein
MATMCALDGADPGIDGCRVGMRSQGSDGSRSSKAATWTPRGSSRIAANKRPVLISEGPSIATDNQVADKTRTTGANQVPDPDRLHDLGLFPMPPRHACAKCLRRDAQRPFFARL